MSNTLIPKISILIITYNQEHLIQRALDSLLKQKQWIYEIIVSDDCSCDNNWEVILEYYTKYPEIIRPFRQEHNVGINKNWEFIWKKTSGDLVYLMAGDDEVCDGLFEKTVNIVRDNKLNCKTDYFTIYFDYISEDCNKRIRYHSNKMLCKGYKPISLKIRGLICNRTSVISINVLKQLKLVREDLGAFADGLIDIQTQLYSSKNFYCPIPGSIYYSGIGVSTIKNKKHVFDTLVEASKEMKKMYPFDRKDLAFLDYSIALNSYRSTPSSHTYILLLSTFCKSIELKYGIRWTILQFCKIIKLFCLLSK